MSNEDLVKRMQECERFCKETEKSIKIYLAELHHVYREINKTHLIIKTNLDKIKHDLTRDAHESLQVYTNRFIEELEKLHTDLINKAITQFEENNPFLEKLLEHRSLFETMKEIDDQLRARYRNDCDRCEY